MSPRAVIVGPPGAGKTTVGRLVADRLGASFRDTDSDVEETAGMPVADLFVEKGEAEFRRLEVEAVERALGSDGTVVALGGGAVLDERTRQALRASGSPVVLLTVTITDAARRIGFNRDRPLLLGNPRQQWTRLLEQRRPLYEEVATVTVDTDGREPEDVAADVVRAVQP